MASYMKIWRNCLKGNAPGQQVGSYSTSRQWWGRPEQMPGNRPVFLVDSTHHGSDLLAGTAAALAASSMVFQQTSKPYADTLYNHAEMLFQ
jgi:endoglucanase